MTVYQKGIMEQTKPYGGSMIFTFLWDNNVCIDVLSNAIGDLSGHCIIDFDKAGNIKLTADLTYQELDTFCNGYETYITDAIQGR